jgi:PAS domain S-box-containing protein
MYARILGGEGKKTLKAHQMTEAQKTIQEATEGELFRLLVENVKDYAIFVVDPEGRVQSWNPGAERLLGYPEVEIIGQPVARFFTPEDIQGGVPDREMRKAVESGRGEDERWHVRKDGSRFWSGGTITPLWDEEGNLRGFAKIMRDRTCQKSSDDALKDALAYAEGVVETVREPLLVLGGDLRVKTANRSFYQMFQASAEETEGRLIYHLGDHQWDIPLLRKLLEEILPLNRSFDAFQVEHEFRATGRKLMLLNARRFTHEGDQTKLILLAFEDITERRRAEEERREIETRFTSLVKHIRVHSIFTMDQAGRITSWNEEAERILGYSEAEVLGQSFSIIFTPEDLQNGLPGQELRTARDAGLAEDDRWHVRKGGERFWGLGIVTPTHDASGKHTGFSKILRDMTVKKGA